MQAKAWESKLHGELFQRAKRRARIIANDWIQPLIGIARLPAGFLPWAALDDALDNASHLIEKHTADLSISSLDEQHGRSSLPDRLPPVQTKTGEGPVFLDGVKTTFTVQHNGQGMQKILLEWIELEVTKRQPGVDDYFSWKKSGDRVFGAGVIEPMRFFVEIDANGVLPARRQIREDDGKKVMLVADGPNVLNTDPASFYSFAPDEDPQILQFTVTAIDAGYYEARFCFLYRVERELRSYTTEKICFYSEG